ncbi:MAG: TM1812 family CRISPR-associated protein [Pyrobaculum sp.]
MGRALVLASWGLPTKWREGLYIRPRIPRGRCPRPSEMEYVEDGVRSRTSLAAIVKTLVEAGHEPDVVIVGLDTLAFPGDYPDVLPDARKALEELYAKMRRGEAGYGDVVEAARAFLGAYVRAYLQDYADRTEVVVVPGSGVYKAGNEITAYFHSDLQNAETAVLAALYEKAQRQVYDAVAVDMTHGVNYLAATLYKASEVAALYISAAQRREVCYAVFNSDPVYNDGERSRINIVKLERISEEPSLFVSKMAEELEERLYAMAKPERAPQQMERLNQRYRALYEKARLPQTAQALAYGFGLYMVEKAKALADAANEARRLVEEAQEAMRREVKVEARGAASPSGDVAIERSYAVNPSPVYLAMAVDVYTKHFGHVQTDEEGGTDLDTLKNLPLHEPARTILLHEISDVEERVALLREYAPLPEGRYVDYNYIYDLTTLSAIQLKRKKEEPPPCEAGDKCDVSKRNYIAHAGLERTAICVKTQGGKIYVRYKDKCREVVEGMLAGGG